MAPPADGQAGSRATAMHFPTAAEVAREMQWGRRLQGLAHAGQLVDEREFAARLRWNAQALHVALATNRVFFLEHDGVRYFPAFYASVPYRLRQLKEVTCMLGTLPGGSKWQFFSQPKGSLAGRTPLDALARGDFTTVKKAADGFANR